MTAAAAQIRALRWLRSPEAIRERCGRVYAAAEAGALKYFSLHPERLEDVCGYVLTLTRERYPDLDIPYHSRWRHFDAGGRDRWAELAAGIGDAAERGRVGMELAVVSVLLDAGAGPAWRYHDDDGARYSRSEGLAVASLAAYRDGLFSAEPAHAPHRADAEALAEINEQSLAAGFQADAGNPLLGIAGRAALLRELGRSIARRPEVFGEPARLGRLFDHLRASADGRAALPAAEILDAVLELFGPIWPSELRLAGVKLGDVWPHPAARAGDDPHAPGFGLVPFHKLSQWLCYSLVEPLNWAGVEVDGLERLTGLPEYRNGGLFVDFGVLQAKRPELSHEAWEVGSEAIVEWRALTVILLDRLAERLRAELGFSAAEFPLAKVLQGGSWAAGRRIAGERRASGEPPIRLRSDGTVF